MSKRRWARRAWRRLPVATSPRFPAGNGSLCRSRALGGENAILLPDEPASALDLKNQDVVLTLLGRLADAQALSIAFTTRQPNHAVAVADKALRMLDDAPTLFGTTGAMMTEANPGALHGILVPWARFETGSRDEAAFVPVFGKRKRRETADD